MTRNPKLSLNQFIYHFGWYFSSTVLIAIIALAKSPIYTARFSAIDFGYYSIAIISYTYISLILFSWITPCVWRYYNTYQKQDKLSPFYSTLFSIFLFSSFVLLVITAIIYYSAGNYLFKKIIFLCFFQFASTELLNFILTHLRIEQKARLYNIITSLHAISSFLLLLTLTFYYQQGIESFLTSVTCMNIIFIALTGMPMLRKKVHLSLSVDKAIIRSSASFVLYLVIINSGLLLLNNLDRFFIKWYKGIDDTGYYNQAYNIAQLSFTALIQIFFSAITPVYIKTIESDNNIDKKQNLLLLYLSIFIPIAVYFIVFCQEIATVLLSNAFKDYYQVIIGIVLSNLLYGLINFSELKMKFAARYKQLITGLALAIGINCILNMLLLPNYPTQVASITTFISYLALFIYFYFADMRHSLSSRLIQPLKPCFTILLVQVIVHYILKSLVPKHYHVIMAAGEGLVFAVTYYIFSAKKINNLVSDFF